MKKLTKYQLYKISKRLDVLFDQASTQDIDDGMNWYADAYEFCVSTAHLFNTTSWTVAQVLSALSPRNKWEQNLRDTINVFSAVRDGLSPNDISVSTFHRNKFKAFAIARGEVEIDPSSKKTYAFLHNIALLSRNYVTIDVWHLRACFGETMQSVGDLAYEQIQKLTIRKSEALGLKGYEYQAIIWCVIKRLF